jgi:hypothetical protein
VSPVRSARADTGCGGADGASDERPRTGVLGCASAEPTELLCLLLIYGDLLIYFNVVKVNNRDPHYILGKGLFTIWQPRDPWMSAPARSGIPGRNNPPPCRRARGVAKRWLSQKVGLPCRRRRSGRSPYSSSAKPMPPLSALSPSKRASCRPPSRCGACSPVLLRAGPGAGRGPSPGGRRGPGRGYRWRGCIPASNASPRFATCCWSTMMCFSAMVWLDPLQLAVEIAVAPFEPLEVRVQPRRFQ